MYHTVTRTPFHVEGLRRVQRHAVPIAVCVLAWAKVAVVDHPKWRIVLAGYEGEHDDLESDGWHVVAWDTSDGQFNSGGYGRKAGGQAEENATRERLWLSPACNVPSERGQVGLF